LPRLVDNLSELINSLSNSIVADPLQKFVLPKKGPDP